MLTAKLNNGEYISLLDVINIDELKISRQKNEYYCPVCNELVLLKIGSKKRPHFAHFKQSSCHAYSEPESSYHLEGKKQLYNWFKSQKLHVELEKYLPSLSQIPDILTRYCGKNYAIEFQCSSIPEELFLKRTVGYKKEGIIPIWVLGERRIKQITRYIYQLQEMDWLTSLTTCGNSSQFFISTFDPFEKSYHVYSNLYPLSGSQTFATKSSFPLSTLQFKDLLQPKIYNLTSTLLPIWLKRKQNWRINMFRNSSAPVHYLKTLYYNQHLHFSLFPAEAGIPIHNQAFIQTPTYVWQAWILEFFKHRGIDHMFSFKEVLVIFQDMLDRRIFHIRPLILMQGHYSFAIMDYLHVLCEIGHIKKISSTLFVIKKKVRYPNTIEEALQFDKETFQKLKVFL